MNPINIIFCTLYEIFLEFVPHREPELYSGATLVLLIQSNYIAISLFLGRDVPLTYNSSTFVLGIILLLITFLYFIIKNRYMKIYQKFKTIKYKDFLKGVVFVYIVLSIFAGIYSIIYWKN